METTLKNLVVNPIIEAALARLFVAVPFLGWGPVRKVFSHYVWKLVDLVWDTSADQIKVSFVGWKNPQLQDAYDKETIKLKILELQGASPQEVENAIKSAQDRLAEFVRFRGVRD